MANVFQVRLKELREKRGYTSQTALAKALGIAQSTVGGWEAGAREPGYDMMLKIARLLDTPIDYLLGNDDYTPSSQAHAHLERNTAEDGFTFAMQNEYPDLTQEDVEILKNIARQLNVAREKQERK